MLHLRGRRSAALLTVAIAATTIAAVPGSSAQAAPDDTAWLARKLAKDVDGRAVNRHLIALQRFADTTGGTRAASTPGHEKSAAYVHDKLKAAGYEVSYQEFQFVYEATIAETASEVSPVARTLRPHVMSYSPSTPVGGITAQLGVVPVDATPGCEATDFAGTDYTGKIALIKRGSCTFAIKQENAAAAGAVGVLIFNNVEDPEATLSGTLGSPEAGKVPTAGLPRSEGEALTTDAATGPVTVTIDLRRLSEQRTTRNVIAEAPWGKSDNVVMIGAHLDSVVDGAGINDNGTGSAGQLEVALQLAKYKAKNKVRFAWWSAEEFGLLGSEHYVANLPFEDQLDVALYLNFDMIGSPNFVRFIYDGDDSDAVGAGPGPFGSAQIEKVFESYFDSRALTHEGTDFSGRSDYGPFIEVGIPSGGLFTGAEGIKTEAQAAKFGGTAGVAYDKCYHAPCDNLGNVNQVALDQNSDAVAWSVGTFAVDTSAVNGNALARRARAAVTPSILAPDHHGHAQDR